ncbi:hypothetical protein ABKN59_003994 [Abortiporus biennis]
MTRPLFSVKLKRSYCRSSITSAKLYIHWRTFPAGIRWNDLQLMGRLKPRTYRTRSIKLNHKEDLISSGYGIQIVGLSCATIVALDLPFDNASKLSGCRRLANYIFHLMTHFGSICTILLCRIRISSQCCAFLQPSRVPIHNGSCLQSGHLMSSISFGPSASHPGGLRSPVVS